MEELKQQLQARQAQAALMYYKACKEKEQAEEVMKNVNAQITALTQAESMTKESDAN